MTEISFYFASVLPAEKILAKLLEKIISQQERAVVYTDSLEACTRLNTTLWTYSPGSFLPHGTREEGHAEDQPIWLTTQEENPNGASVLAVLGKNCPQDIQSYKKVIFILDAAPETRVYGEGLMKGYQTEGYSVTVWQQNPKGAWEKPAE